MRWETTYCMLILNESFANSKKAEKTLKEQDFLLLIICFCFVVPLDRVLGKNRCLFFSPRQRRMDDKNIMRKSWLTSEAVPFETKWGGNSFSLPLRASAVA